jgi:hypothetical protein
MLCVAGPKTEHCLCTTNVNIWWKSQNRKIGIVKKLLAACQGDEAKFIIRSLEGKLRIGLAEKTVLVSLAHAVVTAHQDPKRKSAEKVAADLEKGAETVKAVFRLVLASWLDFTCSNVPKASYHLMISSSLLCSKSGSTA